MWGQVSFISSRCSSATTPTMVSSFHFPTYQKVHWYLSLSTSIVSITSTRSSSSFTRYLTPFPSTSKARLQSVLKAVSPFGVQSLLDRIFLYIIDSALFYDCSLSFSCLIFVASCLYKSSSSIWVGIRCRQMSLLMCSVLSRMPQVMVMSPFRDRTQFYFLRKHLRNSCYTLSKTAVMSWGSVWLDSASQKQVRFRHYWSQCFNAKWS